MNKLKNSKGTPTKVTSNISDGINLDYDNNSEYGDGDIPNSDKHRASNCVRPDDVPRRDGPGGE